MKKNRCIEVEGKIICVSEINQDDYISLTDMVRGSGDDCIIYNWMRTKHAVEFLGIWEGLNNPDFKGLEFATLFNEAGKNSFHLTPKKWIDATGAIGICSKSGRKGGTYAHKDIAISFASWVSPSFQIYLIKEFQRLKDEENSIHNIEWNMRRTLAATNYRIHTDAIKEELIPWGYLKNKPDQLVYASEAELINLALFGITSKQWRAKYPEETNECKTLRDCADTNQLIVLSNLESMNAMLLRKGVKESDKRFDILRTEAEHQLISLNKINKDYATIISPNKKRVIEQQALHTNTDPIINPDTSQMPFGDAIKKISRAGKPPKDEK